MEIKNAETKLDQADSFLTKLKSVLKKHWGILMLIGVGYFFYWAFTTDFEDEPVIEDIKIENIKDEEIYDDEFDDKYYTDGETFKK